MRMETCFPHGEPVPSQPNYPEAWHPVCLHNTFLDSESPMSSFWYQVGLNLTASCYLGFLVQAALLPRSPTSASGEARADQRVAFVPHPT